MQVIRWIIRVLLITALGIGIGAAIQLLQDQPIIWDQNFRIVVTSPVYAVALLIVTLLSIRVIMFRLGEKTRQG